MQNVVGFETSATHEAMMGALTRQGYAVQQFILTPTQLGVPYSRPRWVQEHGGERMYMAMQNREGQRV